MTDDTTRRTNDGEWQPLYLRLHEALDAAASRTPNRLGWVWEDDWVTFAQMARASQRCARQLSSAGVRAGDTVAAWLPNQVSFAHLLYGCSRIGARLTAINTRARAREAAYILRDSGARLLVFRPSFLGIDFCSMLEEIDPALAGRLGAVRFGPHASEPHVLHLGDPSHPLPESLVSLRDDGAPLPSPDRPPADAEAVLVQYTSGSTADPKGALLHHVHVLNFGHMIIEGMGVRPGESVLNTQPMYHIGGTCGCLSVPLTHGCVMVIPEYYEPARVLSLIERERCVARTGMPTMYLREMQHERFRAYDTSSLRAGWTIAPPSTMDRIHREYPIEGLIQVYALSEGGGTTGDIREPWEVRRASAGKPYPGTYFTIVDPETGAELDAGEVGEIRLSGWSRMLGYVGQSPDVAFDEKGRFRTGDLGHLDQAGRVFFDGRLKDMIKPGGENVSALEVETFLLQHPSIHQVAVIGVPDSDLGEVVMAVVEVVAGQQITADDVIEFCRGQIAGFRVPRHVRFVDEMPLTGSGKILKRSLADRFRVEFEQAAAQ